MSNNIDYYDLAEQIAKAQYERDQLDKHITLLKDQFRQGTTQTYERDGRVPITVRVSPNTRVDDKLAREALTAEEYEAVSKRTIDTAKARAILPNNVLSRITKTYDNKVEVVLG